MHEFAAAEQNYSFIRHCPRCAARYAPQDFSPGPCVFVCAPCGFDFYQNPVPAAVALVAEPGHPGRVLLLKRRTAPRVGHWCLPGGFMAYGEQPAVAAAREVREEVGVEVSVGELLYAGLIDYSYRGRQLCVLELNYIATLTGALPARGLTTAEASEIAFLNLDEVLRAPEQLAFPEHATVLRLFQAAQARLAAVSGGV
jgi:8-oxo-dGTP diphosphatase